MVYNPRRRCKARDRVTIEAMKEPETSTEYDKFKALLNRIVSVPHEEIVRREAEYKKQSEQNPNKRGPKAKGQRLRSVSS